MSIVGWDYGTLYCRGTPISVRTMVSGSDFPFNYQYPSIIPWSTVKNQEKPSWTQNLHLFTNILIKTILNQYWTIVTSINIPYKPKLILASLSLSHVKSARPPSIGQDSLYQLLRNSFADGVDTSLGYLGWHIWLVRNHNWLMVWNIFNFHIYLE